MKKGTGHALPGTYQSGSTKSVVFIDAGQTVTGRVSLTATPKQNRSQGSSLPENHHGSLWTATVPTVFLTVHAGIILAAVFAILVTGCISPFPPPETPVTAVPEATSSQVTGTATGPSAPEGTPLLTANLPYGVTISYPQDWDRKDVGTTGSPGLWEDHDQHRKFLLPVCGPLRHIVVHNARYRHRPVPGHGTRAVLQPRDRRHRRTGRIADPDHQAQLPV